MSGVKNRVCLVVIDGWGISNESKGNAILNAKTPIMDELCALNSHPIEAHGLHVGLPEGLMGNSEVGHLNIGAGRVVYQDIVRINLAVKNKTLVENKHLKEAAERAIKGNGRIHLCGLVGVASDFIHQFGYLFLFVHALLDTLSLKVSDGGVHSHIDHLFALVTALKQLKVPQLFIHFFGDGRDTSPTSGVGFLEQLIDFVNKEQYGVIATIVGRYYAMDRDKRWERIRVCYDALIAGVGEKATIDKAVDVIKSRYAKDETDEFLKPIILSDEGRTKDGDTLIFFDYRADRMREITECMGMERYKDLKSDIKHPKNMYFEISLINIIHVNASASDWNDAVQGRIYIPALFPPESHKNVLAEWLSVNGVTQFHCAETEKYAHVTFFFNGGVEKQFENEERCLVASPKVATYDLDPPMSSAGVADKMIEQLDRKAHAFVMCNFAPPDMVGHTGVYEAAVKAVEATVPFTCSSMKFKFMDKLPDREMALCDVAPTVLKVMGLPLPPEMTGKPVVTEV
ncbi:2,3-bisphosphoglycerate-independent phosphoglycerate mutase [Dirofilaria immitis]|nr:2,3-bisphosphoglycerate-independent phosphoglycerate mutase [Dirofilaria immitis]